MKRHVLVAVTAVSAMALATSAASASGGNNGPNRNPAHRSVPASPGETSGPALAKPASSIALLSNGSTAKNNFRRLEVLQSLSGGSPTKLRVLTGKYLNGIDGAAIDGSGSKSLVAADSSAIDTMIAPRTKPHLGPRLSLNDMWGEGGNDYHFYAVGVGIGGNSALVASDSQGVAQLIWKAGRWRIDTRVRSRGLNDAGFPHARGFIRVPQGSNYDGVVVSPTAMSNGKYLGLAYDHEDKLVAVINGVGTAKPTVKVLAVPTMVNDNTDFAPGNGRGGLAFSPATPTRAVVTTATGFAVINLSRPAKPKIQSATTVGPAGAAESISVSADGKDVAEAVGDSIYTYGGMLTTSPTASLSPVTILPAGDTDGGIYDVDYLVGGSLAVVHGDTSNGWRLDMYRHADTATPVLAHGVVLAAQPDGSNTVSVWPSFTVPKLPARLLAGVKKGHHAKAKLSVKGGIGHYTYKVSSGKLPAGVKLHGATIAGKLKVAGRSHFTITATSQYGEGVRKSYVVTVK